MIKHSEFTFASLLILQVVFVKGDCRNLTRKLFDDQIESLQKSVRLIVDGQCSSNNNPVAFHAYMGSTKTYAKGVVWVYDKVVTNVRNGYNAATGKFTAPAGGIYIFSYEAQYNFNKGRCHPFLFVNGKLKNFHLICSHDGKKPLKLVICGNSTTIHVEKGDVVYITDERSSVIIHGIYSSFTGVKIS